ncbi:hypothetical protein STEG23_009048 [Scotinomys teguina]
MILKSGNSWWRKVPEVTEEDAFVELYGPSVRPLFDFSWLSLKTLLSLALVGACITLGAYLGHKSPNRPSQASSFNFYFIKKTENPKSISEIGPHQYKRPILVFIVPTSESGNSKKKLLLPTLNASAAALGFLK